MALGGDFQAVGHLLQADLGALGCERWVFTERFNEEGGAVEKIVVDGSAAKVNAGDERGGFLGHRV